jgi:hypothetical protein
MSKEIENKITDITTSLTCSENDRLNVQQTAHDVLCGFLLSHVRKLAQKNDLKSALETRFMQALSPESEDELPLVAALKLYEILSKSETDGDSALLGIFSKNPQIFINVDQNNLTKAVEEGQVTQQENEMAKKLLKLFGRLEEQEKSIDEL